MIELFATRLSGGGRAAARGLVLALLLLPTTARAHERRAAQSVDVRSTWREQGRQGYDGIVWFRLTLPVSGKNDAALFLGPPAYGGYEAYAGGRSM